MTGWKRQDAVFLPLRRPGRRRLWRTILALFLLFAPPIVPHLLALRVPAPPSRPADVVFVLTGGAGRIKEGYKVWLSGAGKDFWILGAGRNVKPEQLLPGPDALPPDAHSRIRVEGWSENTLENAFSGKTIVSERGYVSVILVTSDYHIPRAHLAFRKILPPEVGLSVHPVPAESGTPGRVAWRWARRHFLEGWKYWGYRVLLRWG